MIHRRTVVQERRRHVACRPILAGLGVTLALGLASASEARASTYRVFTASAASSMTLNANDGFCSLAEAVQHATGNTIYNCTDFDPSSGEQRIELLESAGKPFSTNHFKITGALTLNRQGIRIHIFGGGGFIDSTAPNSSFVVPFKSIAFFERVTLTNTAGSAGGRLIENYGQLQIYGVTITKGDVTGPQNPSGRGGGIFNGNTQGLFPAVISFAENSLITANKAKKGGGVYNDSGIINELGVTISNNTATQAGGGIYNISTTPPQQGWTNGTIQTVGAIVQGNSARAGGGVFNRGLVEFSAPSSVTGNSTTTTGSSGESCTGSASCDGLGGGILSVHTPNASDTRFMLLGSPFSNNTASARGGAIYSVGVLELGGNAINNNRAPDGAAIYLAPPTDGTQQYCNVFGDANGSATINSNIANQGSYSIVSGASGGVPDFRNCTFGGLPTPGQTTYMTAANNTSPYCRAGTVNVNSRCPQP
jgi:predicted outer membrane repeat protein